MSTGEARPRNFGETGGVAVAGAADVQIPLGPGEFDEPLGLPLCVVCQNVCTQGGVQVSLLLNETYSSSADY